MEWNNYKYEYVGYQILSSLGGWRWGEQEEATAARNSLSSPDQRSDQFCSRTPGNN